VALPEPSRGGAVIEQRLQDERSPACVADVPAQGLLVFSCKPVQHCGVQQEGHALSLAQLEPKHTSLHGHRLSATTYRRAAGTPAYLACKQEDHSTSTHGHKAAVHARHNRHRLEDGQRQWLVEGAPVQHTQCAGEARCLQLEKTAAQQGWRVQGSLELLMVVQHVLQRHCGTVWNRTHYYGMRASSS